MKTYIGELVIKMLLAVFLFSIAEPALCGDPDTSDDNDPNFRPIVELGSEMKKVPYLVEAAYWPDLDFKNTKDFIAKGTPKEKNTFVTLAISIIDPNYLPEKLPEKTRFLSGWRGKSNRSFIAQYEKREYTIHIKDHVSKVKNDITRWISIVVQAKDKSRIIKDNDAKAILAFSDRFLVDKVGSEAQDYSHVKEMEEPFFKKMDTGYFLAYPVAASKPDIDGVCIWSDGFTVIINLQERQKKVKKS